MSTASRISLGFLFVLVLVHEVHSWCPDSCEPNDAPVCGTDGKTYKNTCAIVKFSCGVKNGKVKVKHYGKCDVEADGKVDCLRIGRNKYLKC